MSPDLAWHQLKDQEHYIVSKTYMLEPSGDINVADMLFDRQE